MRHFLITETETKKIDHGPKISVKNEAKCKIKRSGAVETLYRRNMKMGRYKTLQGTCKRHNHRPLIFIKGSMGITIWGQGKWFFANQPGNKAVINS